MAEKVLLMIDAGHGGTDPGSKAFDGTLEKTWNLTISTYEYNRFLELGLTKDQIKMTRHGNESQTLYQKGNIIKKSRAVLAISNHCNAFNSKAYGAEAFYSVKENGSLAKSIGNKFKAYGIKWRRNEAKKNSSGGNYYGIIRYSEPTNTTIIEYAFIDNPKEFEFLKGNWKNMCEMVIESICEELKIEYTKPGQKVVEKVEPVKVIEEAKKVEQWMVDACQKAFNEGWNSELHKPLESATFSDLNAVIDKRAKLIETNIVDLVIEKIIKRLEE